MPRLPNRASHANSVGKAGATRIVLDHRDTAPRTGIWIISSGIYTYTASIDRQAAAAYSRARHSRFETFEFCPAAPPWLDLEEAR